MAGFADFIFGRNALKKATQTGDVSTPTSKPSPGGVAMDQSAIAKQGEADAAKLRAKRKAQADAQRANAAAPIEPMAKRVGKQFAGEY